MLTVWLLAAIALTREGRKNPARLAKVSAPLNVVVLTLLLLQAGRYIQSVRHNSFEAEQGAIVTAHTGPEIPPEYCSYHPRRLWTTGSDQAENWQ